MRSNILNYILVRCLFILILTSRVNDSKCFAAIQGVNTPINGHLFIALLISRLRTSLLHAVCSRWLHIRI